MEWTLTDARRFIWEYRCNLVRLSGELNEPDIKRSANFAFEKVYAGLTLESDGGKVRFCPDRERNAFEYLFLTFRRAAGNLRVTPTWEIFESGGILPRITEGRIPLHRAGAHGKARLEMEKYVERASKRIEAFRLYAAQQRAADPEWTGGDPETI